MAVMSAMTNEQTIYLTLNGFICSKICYSSQSATLGYAKNSQHCLRRSQDLYIYRETYEDL